MTGKNKPKISVSVSDFPIFRGLEYSFSEAKKAGADGVEIVYGFKTQFFLKKILKLSKKYHLPIFSIHQPLWTAFGVPDYRFFKFAKILGAKNITLHPMAKIGLNSPKAKVYFKKMSKLSRKYKLNMLLENMPVNEQAPIIDSIFPGNPESQELLKILEIAKKYNFKITLDTSHLEDKNLGKNPILKKILPNTENIHLSSFSSKQAHLPLHLGNFDYKSFLKFLKQDNYNGLITLEVYYPNMIAIRNFDYNAIKKSINIIKKELSI